MKISLNWVRQFTDVDLAIDDLVTKIGAQLGAVEEVIDLGAKYQKIVVAKVISCEDHPNADRLHVCTIDDGGVTPDVKRDEQGYVQVVCGATNVRAGLSVAWLPPGSTVPSSYDKDPFVLDARELRGVMSNGMLASPKELAIGDDHNGILEIDIEATPGTAFADVYQLNDYIIDVENKMFTHRPDCFGMIGVAREISGIQHKPFVSPEWYATPLGRIQPGKTKLPLVVDNQLPELVPRFCAIAMASATIQPSPVTIQSYLARVGVRPINNIVDTTNYLMLLTGQPLHAYDYDKVVAQDSGSDTATIVVRKPLPDESLELLNGKTITPRADAIVIATKTRAIGLGGVMGGGDTEVDNNTKNIILEVANFDMYSIRRTAMAHGVFTDAVTRFNKGQSPLQNDRIIEEAVMMVEAYSGAHVASDQIDNHQTLPVWQPIRTTSSFINERLGVRLQPSEMKQLLDNVECIVEADGDDVTVTPPFWRTDIEIPEDIVEEIGRLYGYDQLPLDLPKRTITPAKRNSLMDLQRQIRNSLARAGANEVVTYSFVHGNLLDKVGEDKTEAYQISNALSPDLQYYRLSLLPSLLERVHANTKAGYDAFTLFECGKAHRVGALTSSDDPRETDLPREFERLALVFAANAKAAARFPGAAYYQAKNYLMHVLKTIGLEAVSFQSFTEDSDRDGAPAYYEPTRAARISTADGQQIGYIGELKKSVRTGLKLPDTIAGFELDMDVLLANYKLLSNYVTFPKFPKVEQDICLKVDRSVAYQAVYDLAFGTLAEIVPDHTHYDLQPLDIYQRQDDSDHKQVTLRLRIASYQRTLTDIEVTALLDEVSNRAVQDLGAERI